VYQIVLQKCEYLNRSKHLVENRAYQRAFSNAVLQRDRHIAGVDYARLDVSNSSSGIPESKLCLLH
jgi:hypothetical protein